MDMWVLFLFLFLRRWGDHSMLKGYSVINGVAENGIVICKTITLNPDFLPYPKINTK